MILLVTISLLAVPSAESSYRRALVPVSARRGDWAGASAASWAPAFAGETTVVGATEVDVKPQSSRPPSCHTGVRPGDGEVRI